MEPGLIRFKAGAARFAAQTVDQTAEVLQAVAAAGERHFVIQFHGPITPQERTEVEACGVKLLSYLSNHAFFGGIIEESFDPIAATEAADIFMVERIDPGWKLHADLAAGAVYEWMVVNPPEELRRQGFDPAALQNPRVAAYMLFHSDVDLEAEGADVLRAHGAQVRSLLRTVNGAVIELPYDNLAALAAEDAVMWVEPPLPQFTELNDSNRQLVGADIVQAAPYELSGVGVSVLVYDGGVAAVSHPDFGWRLFARDCSGLSLHASHVCGTIGGSGEASGGTFRGMAPGVVIQSYGYAFEGGFQEGSLYTDPGDIELDYADAINNYAAAIANNSIGTNTASNGFPCEWEGNYGVTDTVIDAIARGSLSGEPFRIVWAAGNERGDGSCGTDYFTSAPPANAKNHITVGAVNSNDDSITSFTSWGPSDDGRMRPDLVAPGCQIGGDDGVTSCDSGSGYVTACGTSMSSPTVCGLGALLIEDFRQQFPGEPDMRGSMLKAILANTTQDIGNVGPDYQAGMGSVRIQPAADLLRAGNFYESEVDQGGTVGLDVIVGPGDTQLRVTLAWDDPPGTPVVNPTLVNDLDLIVYDDAAHAYYPWTLDPANPSAPAVQTQPNRRDNMEQLTIDNPAPGVYRIEVTGFDVPMGPQPFSIAATPLLVACSDAGTISLNQNNYPCDGPAMVQVVDCGLNTDYAIIDTVAVTMASSSEPGGETIVLIETTPESATFRGTIDLSQIDTPGVLLIAPGDTITGTYIDADDGQGGVDVVVTDLATVDCTPPLITDVQAVGVLPRSASIAFTTDEPASARVRYGMECDALNAELAGFGMDTDHLITLNGLTAETTYFFEVEATDEAGNVATDNNGGACYSFTTPAAIYVPDDFATIQAAINAAPNGELIIVRPGTYVENLDFCGKVLEVRSEEGPELTIIDGNASGSVVKFVNNEGPGSTLNGFTLTNGTGTEVWPWGVVGGGVFCYGIASPTIINNIITANSANFGGGINCDGMPSPVIRGNRIATNNATTSGGGVFMALNNASALIEDNVIEDNASDGLGGGLALFNGTFFVSGNTIARNVAAVCLSMRQPGAEQSGDNFGGGMYLKHRGNQPTVITNNIFVDNISTTGGGGLAIDSVGLWPQIVNNLFTGNAASYGGAVHGDHSNSILANNTIAGNSANTQGGGVYWGADSDLVVVNSIVRQNLAPENPNLFRETGSTASVTYCNIGGGWPGVGNIDVNPLFVDASNADYRLGIGSPCIDAGDSTAVPEDSADLDGDGDTSERTPLDLDEFPRFVDYATPDTGVADPPDYPQVVDMGAYEFGDCNQNDIPDECDVDCGEPGGPCDIPGCGQSSDCNGNGIPDECDWSSDCNGNGVPDLIDIAEGTSPDCNGNCVPDECDVVPPPWDYGVAHWRFEEAGGDTVLDSGPNGLDGRLNALPFRTTDIAIDPVPQSGFANTQSLDLNWQSTTSGGFFTVPDTAGLLSLGDENFAIEGWVKLVHLSDTSSSDERQYLCQKKPLPSQDSELDYAFLVQRGNNGGHSPNYGKTSGFTGRELQLVFGQGSFWDTWSVTSHLEITDYDWHHVSAAYDTRENVVRFGIDDIFETASFSDNRRVTNRGALRVGSHQNGVGVDNFFLLGSIDELRISRRCVPVAELLNVAPSSYSEDANGNGIPDECEPDCPGDLDGDGDVDLSDLSILLANYGMTGGAEYDDGDLNFDGDVDLGDLAALLAVYGAQCR
jgi:hypothetical protein